MDRFKEEAWHRWREEKKRSQAGLPPRGPAFYRRNSVVVVVNAGGAAGTLLSPIRDPSPPAA